jgi:hypothetical protein
MSVRALMRQPTAYLPVAMSAGALAMVVWFVAVHGVVHQSDEAPKRICGSSSSPVRSRSSPTSRSGGFRQRRARR